jgi:hypothetical protein
MQLACAITSVDKHSPWGPRFLRLSRKEGIGREVTPADRVSDLS